MPHHDLTDEQIDALPIEQRTNYWKLRARSFENVARARADYDEIAEKARQWDARPKDDQGRPLPGPEALAAAADTARAEAFEQTRRQLHGQIVRAEFRAAAPGLPTETLDALLEDLDLSKYVDEDGTVDTPRVTRKVTALTGARPSWQGRR